MWFQMIEKLNGRQILGGFNQSQIRDIFQGFKYEITNEIGGEMGGEVEEGDVRVGFPLSRYQVYKWFSMVQFSPEV